MRSPLLLVWIVAVLPAIALADRSAPPESKPKKYGAAELALYNEGVKLMLEKRFAEAQVKFQAAIEENEKFPEAHNNLAYTLRKQGEAQFERALKHYNRAIELDPNSPEPYMYRGVLYVQMKKTPEASKDLAKLEELAQKGPKEVRPRALKLVPELKHVIDTGKEKEPEQFFGVSPRIE